MAKTPQVKSTIKTEHKPARPTKAMLDDFVRLREQKKLAEAESRRIDKEMTTLKARLVAFTEANENEVETCGYRLRMVETGRFPAWKDAYIEALGSEAAEELTANTPPRVGLEVEAL